MKLTQRGHCPWCLGPFHVSATKPNPKKALSPRPAGMAATHHRLEWARPRVPSPALQNKQTNDKTKTGLLVKFAF
jgi:hypothetical protein